MSAYLRRLTGSDRATVPEVLAARAESTPNAPLLWWDSRTWSYVEGLQEARRVAALLRDLGVAGPVSRVASFLGNSPEAWWAWFGAHIAGSVYVALNRNHRGEVLTDMLERSRARVLITDTEALEVLPDPGRMGIEAVLVTGDLPPGLAEDRYLSFGQAPQADPEMEWPPAKPGDLASILYTSGTTGRSKAVMIPHNYLCRVGAWFAELAGLRPEDRWHGWMPMYHIFGQLDVTMGVLVAGASVAMYPTFSRSRFWDQVHESKCTIFGGLANLLRMLWQDPSREANRDNPLRLGLIASPPPELRDAFSEHFGVELMDSYGMTEAEAVTLSPPGTGATSCGPPIPDFEIAILDDLGRALPAGERGEIAVRPREPDVMFQGYEGDEKSTIRAWKGLWFHTGDFGRRDEDGNLYLLDRRKHVIRKSGENVSPSEVEGIIRQHAHVHDCVVVGVPSPIGDEDVKAVVVPEAHCELDPAEIHAYCLPRMARFMMPRYVEIREFLPYSNLGKVDREALKDDSEEAWDAHLTQTAGVR